MRKSEAELLQEQLEEYHGNEWSMTVVNLRNLGFHVPETEHPYFIAALRANHEDASREETVKKVFEKKSEVVIWDNNKKSWTVHQATRWQIQRHARHEEKVYIFDTRERQFVPIDQFQLPPESE